MCYQEESTLKIIVKQELCHTTILYRTANIALESLDGNLVFNANGFQIGLLSLKHW